MNWYLQQKEAWNWKAMLPGGGAKPAPITPKPPAKPLEAPGINAPAHGGLPKVTNPNTRYDMDAVDTHEHGSKEKARAALNETQMAFNQIQREHQSLMRNPSTTPMARQQSKQKYEQAMAAQQAALQAMEQANQTYQPKAVGTPRGSY